MAFVSDNDLIFKLFDRLKARQRNGNGGDRNYGSITSVRKILVELLVIMYGVSSIPALLKSYKKEDERGVRKISTLFLCNSTVFHYMSSKILRVSFLSKKCLEKAGFIKWSCCIPDYGKKNTTAD